MADTKVSNFPPSAGLVLTDIFPVVDDPGGTPEAQKATFTQLETLFSASFAPAGSGVTSFNTRTGAVTLLLADVSAVADARYVLKTGDTMTGDLTLNEAALSITKTDPLTPALQVNSTWDNGDPYTAFRVNVTSNSSDPSSILFGVFLGGSSMFLIDRSVGNVALSIGTVGANIGFFGTGPVVLQNANTAESVHTALVNYGLINSVAFSRTLIQMYIAKTATYTIDPTTDYTVDCTANTFTVNLPTGIGITGQVFVVKNSGAGTITLDGNGSQTIDGSATQTIAAGASLIVQSTGVNWIILANE